MRLIIGGRGQGKLDYALNMLKTDASSVAENFNEAQIKPILYGLHSCIRSALLEKKDVDLEIRLILERRPDIVIICDEVGLGVVPADPFERLFRDEVGRICCGLAKRAETVDRVFCGIPQRIKGG